MSIEIPQEYADRINKLKAKINNLESQKAPIQAAIDAVREGGVEIKLVVKSIEEIDAKVPELKQMFINMTQDRAKQLSNIDTAINACKEELRDVVTEALLK